MRDALLRIIILALLLLGMLVNALPGRFTGRVAVMLLLYSRHLWRHMDNPPTMPAVGPQLARIEANLLDRTGK